MPLRALVLKSNDFPVAGHTRLTEMYVAHLDRSRVEPVLGHINADDKEPSLVQSSDRLTDMEHHVIPWQGIKGRKRAAEQLQQLVRETGVDIVTSNDMRSDLVCRVAGGRKGLGIPWTSFVHGWTGWRHVWHGWQVRLGDAKYAFYEWVDRWCVKGTDEVWVGSHSCGDVVRKHLPQRVPIRVLMNAAEPYYLRPVPGRAAEIRATICGKLGLPSDALLVGTLGRMAIAKGHALLAKAVAKCGVPNMAAVLIGFGEEEENLVQMAKTEPYAGKVYIPGSKASLTEVAEHLEALDIFCFPSLQESLPVAMLEAMYLDNAIAASITGDIPRVLENGKTGLLFEPGDVDAMAQCLHQLGTDAQLRESLRQRAKERVLSHFCAPRYSKDVENAWVALVEKTAAAV